MTEPAALRWSAWSPDIDRQRRAEFTIGDVLVAHSAQQLVLAAPFDIRLDVRDLDRDSDS